MKCPYCGSNTIIADSTIVYGKSYGFLIMCDNYPICDSYVGCHKNTKKPLGRLSNYELRTLKKQAHLYFDSLWRHKLSTTGDFKSRKKAYAWLANIMGKPIKSTHIGYFDIEETQKVIKVCEPYYYKLKGVMK